MKDDKRKGFNKKIQKDQNKKNYFTHKMIKQITREEKKKKRKNRKKRRRCLTNFLEKPKSFLDTSKHESKKGEPVFFPKNKNEKENQKGESQKKKTRNYFSRHKKRQNTDKQNVKKCPAKTGNRQI